MSLRRVERMDYTLLAAAMLLLSWGLIMVYSASAIWAEQNFGQSSYFLKRQLLWAFLGLVAMFSFSRFNYNRFREWIGPIFFVTVLALAAALLSLPVAGVRRWIHIGPVGFQPAEMAKLTAVLFLAYYLDRRRSRLDSLWWGLAVPCGFVGILLALIAREPDLGTPILILAVSFLLIFIGGGRLRHLLGAAVLASPILAYEMLKYPYRRARLLSFMNPFEHAQGAGYQLSQSLLAVGSGGWFGKGLGASKLKLMYLPTPQSDFIFPILCEELGLLGALVLLLLFVVVLARGTRIARNASNLFGTLLAAGITFTICLQAFFNISMSIGLLPTKGLPLPFVSAGGSSLLVTLVGVGILLNISKHSQKEVLTLATARVPSYPA